MAPVLSYILTVNIPRVIRKIIRREMDSIILMRPLSFLSIKVIADTSAVSPGSPGIFAKDPLTPFALYVYPDCTGTA
jgi:hypothetical protein